MAAATKQSDVTRARGGKDISAAVREICLAFPETEEVSSHGAPDFRIVGGKTFASYAINHHGDGHLALWLRMSAGAQALYVAAEPHCFFVPPYVGPSGWLGVDLDKGLDWGRVADLVRQAYVEAAPRRLVRDLGPAPEITPPTRSIDPEAFDPFAGKAAQARLRQVRATCLAYPETAEARHFGNPCFRAGKKNFCTLYFRGGALRLSTWAGPEGQASLTFDPRYEIAPYTGHNGWIDLRLDKPPLAGETENLIEVSYRHFALQRMLKALDAVPRHADER